MKLSPMFVWGAALVMFWILIALSAPLLATHDPYAIDFEALLAPPSADHWFGADNVGRDTYSRVIYGSRLALYIGLLGVIAPMVIGMTIGLLAGYFGGWVDTIAMRILDITVPFPFFVLVLSIVAVLGPGIENYFIALALVGWVGYARLARAEAIVLRSSEFVLAARTMGFSHPYILFRHVLPNAMSPVVVYMMTDVTLVILFGAALGFLGMGVSPPAAEWGVMIAEGQIYISTAWWISFFPGLAMVLIGVGFALMGDGLAKMLRIER
ncbi:ABC peptide transporter, inner membrane subunit [Sulfitobacter noctilucae]|uniref:ABC transporter permease n=1 Tax=Sulfitobacter noctilucae TaxID=1342302 RepID=UPI0004682E23|nr:ABC transporter permease [Sulfitobacter noctilucae]KIN74968.1 ABC peptide transporter, inner membrane subunit [Sulfitobacter noctilucae]